MNGQAKSRAASIMAMAGVVIFILVVLRLHQLQPDYDAKSQLISELALGPHGQAMLAAFAGLAMSAAGIALMVWRTGGSSFLSLTFCVAALLFLLAGVFPLGQRDLVHIAAIAGAFVVAVLGIFLFPRYSGHMAALVPKAFCFVLGGGVALAVLLGHSVLDMGIAQRLAAACLLVWLFCVGWKGWTAQAPGRIKVPQHIRSMILDAIHDEGQKRYPMDYEAASHGTIALMGTLGLIWGLRADGTFWKFDEEFLPLTQLEPEWEIAAIVLGSERYPWLAELIPKRPTSARTCPACNGTGQITAGLLPGSSGGLICPECRT